MNKSYFVSLSMALTLIAACGQEPKKEEAKQIALPSPTPIPTEIEVPTPPASPTHVPTTVPSGFPAVPGYGGTGSFPSNFPTSVPTSIPNQQIPRNLPRNIPTNIPTHVPTTLPTNMPNEDDFRIPPMNDGNGKSGAGNSGSSDRGRTPVEFDDSAPLFEGSQSRFKYVEFLGNREVPADLLTAKELNVLQTEGGQLDLVYFNGQIFAAILTQGGWRGPVDESKRMDHEMKLFEISSDSASYCNTSVKFSPLGAQLKKVILPNDKVLLNPVRQHASSLRTQEVQYMGKTRGFTEANSIMPVTVFADELIDDLEFGYVYMRRWQGVGFDGNNNLPNPKRGKIHNSEYYRHLNCNLVKREKLVLRGQPLPGIQGSFEPTENDLLNVLGTENTRITR